MLPSPSSLSKSCLVLLAGANVTIFMPTRTVRPSQSQRFKSSHQRYVNISNRQFHVNRTTNMQYTDKHFFTPRAHFHCAGFQENHNDWISSYRHIAHLPQQCHNSKLVIFQERFLKVLKCYNFLWVQRRHNCPPAASFTNCVMTLYLLKAQLQTFLSIQVTQKCQILSCDTLVANERYIVPNSIQIRLKM
jgi:hypothetical protein